MFARYSVGLYVRIARSFFWAAKLLPGRAQAYRLLSAGYER